jgi:UDP-N-acetylmuramyl pentapeptide synthase
MDCLIGTDAQIDGVAIDTRKIKPGDLFVALKGEHVDGHDYLVDAKARGAAALRWLSAQVDSDLPQVQVETSSSRWAIWPVQFVRNAMRAWSASPVPTARPR